MLEVITIIIQQLDRQIVPYAATIVECMKIIWKNASSSPNESYNLLKQSSVRALTKLVQVLHSFVSPFFDSIRFLSF